MTKRADWEFNGGLRFLHLPTREGSQVKYDLYNLFVNVR